MAVMFRDTVSSVVCEAATLHRTPSGDGKLGPGWGDLALPLGPIGFGVPTAAGFEWQ